MVMRHRLWSWWQERHNRRDDRRHGHLIDDYLKWGRSLDVDTSPWWQQDWRTHAEHATLLVLLVVLYCFLSWWLYEGPTVDWSNEDEALLGYLDCEQVCR